MESQEVQSYVFDFSPQPDDDSQEITLSPLNLVVKDTPKRKNFVGKIWKMIWILKG